MHAGNLLTRHSEIPKFIYPNTCITVFTSCFTLM